MTRISGSPSASVGTTVHRPTKFPGRVREAGWSPGSGIRPAFMGVYVDAQVNPLTKVGAKMKLDEAKKTLTVTLTGKAGKPNHMADTTKHLELGIPRGLQMGEKYKLIVQDANHHVLKTTSITPFPAA